MKQSKKVSRTPLPVIHHQTPTYNSSGSLTPLTYTSSGFLFPNTKSERRNSILLLNTGETLSRTPIPSDILDSQTYRKLSYKNSKTECLSDRNSTKSFSSTVLKTKLDLVLALRNLFDDDKEPKRTLNRIKMIIKALEILSNEDGKYKDELKRIVEEIRNAIFINKGEVEEDVLEYVYESYPETITDLDGLIPFFYLYPLKLKKKDTKEYFTIETVNKIKENCKLEIDKLKEEIEKLNGKIELHDKENEKILEENSKYKAELDQKTKENFILLNKVSVLQHDIIGLRYNADEDNRIIVDYQKKSKISDELMQKLNSDYSALNRNYDELKKTHDTMTHGYATILYKLKQSYETQEDLERQISELIEKNSALSVRAAAGYEELTPRPNLEPIFSFLEVEIPKGSTIEKTNEILKEVKNKIRKRTLTRKNLLNSGIRQLISRKITETDFGGDQKNDPPVIQMEIPKLDNE
ncbi:unnamed protein product [Blepharisma stoltei]|uniref:Translin-associated factor X-interacting protein 1 N-terminal domain-containing protein n=1 Tax=Blepharisma stoltei TaxID=1481888 RepID=A0AAU9K6U3_9CILI|nr:unnamed protein product [Blepharisma stoltei]